MSATEIIEQIKALPKSERSRVLEFVKSLGDNAGEQKQIHFASPEQAKEAGDRVVRQYPDVFQKLAQ